MGEKTEKQEFCHNSRRWIIFMTMGNSIPSTCPYNDRGGGCIGGDCSYHQMREPTESFKRKEQLIRAFFGT